MRNTIRFSFLLFSLLLTYKSNGQGLAEDQPFFKAQSLVYQQWLEDTGMGNILKVHTIGVEDEALSLYLAFPTTNADSCWAFWDQLQKDFGATKNISLEQQLFYQLITIMDVPQSMTNIQIYNTYDLSMEPCFFVGIYFDEGAKQVQTQRNICKSHQESIFIESANLDNLKKESETPCVQTLSRKDVFNKIKGWAEQHYTTSACEGRFPEIVLLEKSDVLRFRADDICLQVLQDQSNPTLCWMRNRICYKRERLTFTITYENDADGISVGIEIDGRYGSGYFRKVGRKGYHLMDEEFKEELVDYTQRVREMIRPLLCP